MGWTDGRVEGAVLGRTVLCWCGETLQMGEWVGRLVGLQTTGARVG